ncbi:MAG: histidinol-phosphate transaminase [Gammaproteobacteria bacterium]|nr:histidinol-phosphate transaminase [Gammaproteobacteria bacterium]
MSIVELARPEIRALKAYEAAQQVDNTIRLNANESPQVNPVDHFRRPLNRYPEVRPAKLQAALAGRYGCRTSELLVTRGSSEAIDLLIRCFCRAGIDSVVTTSPSFSMYGHYSKIQGAQFVEVATRAERNFEIDVDELLQACDENSRLLFVCSPNNPTGTLLPAADLQKLLTARAGRSAVVVDEAYVEFGPAESAVSLLDQYPNLLVLRTLSKALGFAGARCGAVVGPQAVIQMLSAVQAPYAMSTPVVECVEDALQDEQLAAADDGVAAIVAERERVTARISKFPFVKKVWPSAANFFLVQVNDARRIMQRCEDDGILLRYYGGDLADCVRISIGSRAENDRLLQALDTLTETE